MDPNIQYSPSNGHRIKFWEDVWMGDQPLAICYPYLYDLCSNKSIVLSLVISSQGLAITFTRTLTGVNRCEWGEVLQIIHSVSPTLAYDKICWTWESNGIFSIKSIYQFLSFRGVATLHALTWWDSKLPPKIQVFMWLLTHNKILTKNNLQKKGWHGNTSCHFCSIRENVAHLFLNCSRARHIWFWMGSCQNLIEHWHSISDILEFVYTLPQPHRNAFLTVFGALAWNVWNQRNAICFNQSSCPSIRTSVIQIINWVLLWTGNDAPTAEAAQTWLPRDLSDIPLQEVPAAIPSSEHVLVESAHTEDSI